MNQNKNLNYLTEFMFNCRDLNSQGMLPSGLVAQSVKQQGSNPKVVGSTLTLVKALFLFPCVSRENAQMDNGNPV